MATKRSGFFGRKKTPRTKKAAVDPVVETQASETPTEPTALASEPVAVPEPVALAPEPVAVPESAQHAAAVPVDEIRRRAYNYWVQGNPDPIANWFRAENELKSH